MALFQTKLDIIMRFAESSSSGPACLQHFRQTAEEQSPRRPEDLPGKTGENRKVMLGFITVRCYTATQQQ